MRKLLLIAICCVSVELAWADHITGGEMFYTYVGTSNGMNTYAVTLKLFMRCNSGRQFPNPAIISVFDRSNGSRFMDVSQEISYQETIQILQNDPCITNPPTVCYEVAYYQFGLSLPVSQTGYTLASQVNYRIRGIANIYSEQVGATYTCEIPGTQHGPGTPQNNSAFFTGSDLVVVCAGNNFSYSFAASDRDNDQIRYSFCTGYNSSSQGVNGVPAGPPPYSPLPYNSPEFSADAPLGARVSIDPNTGLITGVAPAAGIYVVTVCAEEIRNNVVIATQRKDLQINITDCSIAAAQLESDYMLCRNSRSMTFQNLSNSPLIVSQNWSILDPGGNVVSSGAGFSFSYTFPVDGIYTLKLVVNRGQPCTDSSTAPVYVFPGMNTAFSVSGICFGRPTLFTDQSVLTAGPLLSWNWDFGEAAATNDRSTTRNATYTYPTPGNKRILLTVQASNGCRDTVSQTISIIEKPPLSLAFRDTLICRNDVLTLQAGGTGSFNWSPLVSIQQAGTATPQVSPASTTRYFVDLSIDGCTNRDSVLVRVVDFVTLNAMNDTTICRGDSIRLRVSSDGLRYLWTPATQLSDPTLANPLAYPLTATTYQVRATIGGCSETDEVRITPVPYPLVAAGSDTTICYNTTAFLQGTTNGTSWQWSPASSLNDAGILSPSAYPSRTLNYILTVYDQASGCPKPSRDTILVTVLPRIVPFAGNDTAVVVNQPLQLQASGGVTYQWIPGSYLSSSGISNPVAVFNEPATQIRYKVLVYNSIGCVDSSFLSVKVYASMPTVYVPTAFTPNYDGLNDQLRPIAVGFKHIEYFQIYNRWGQRVFETRINGAGWDGTVNGQPQASNTYVWMVKAVDFNGKAYFRKGLVTLIR